MFIWSNGIHNRPNNGPQKTLSSNPYSLETILYMESLFVFFLFLRCD